MNTYIESQPTIKESPVTNDNANLAQYHGKKITETGWSIQTPLSTIQRNVIGSEQRGKTRRRKALGAIVLVAWLKSEAGAHEALNARSTQGGNQAPLEFRAAFGQDPRPAASPFAVSLAGTEHGRARGVVCAACDRHASSDQPRAERRCHRRSGHARRRRKRRRPRN